MRIFSSYGSAVTADITGAWYVQGLQDSGHIPSGVAELFKDESVTQVLVIRKDGNGSNHTRLP